MESVHITLPVAELLPPVEVESSATYDVEPAGDFENPMDTFSTQEPLRSGGETRSGFESLTLESFAELVDQKDDCEEDPEPPASEPASGEQGISNSAGDLPEPPETEPNAPAELSNWEARLKRALADDTGVLGSWSPGSISSQDHAPEPAATEPISGMTDTADPASAPDFEPPAEFQRIESLPVEEPTETPDFEVSAGDLFPAPPHKPVTEKKPDLPTFEEPIAAGSEGEGNATVRYSGDDTVNERGAVSSESSDRETLDNEAEHPAADWGPWDDPDPRSINRGRRRAPSLVRWTASAALGIVGIPLGLYVLLWIKGPEADVAHLGAILPDSLLPAAMRSQSSPSTTQEQLAHEPAGSSQESEGTELAADSKPELIEDPAVQMASANLQTANSEEDLGEAEYQGPKFSQISGEHFREVFGNAVGSFPVLAEQDFQDKVEKATKVKAFMSLCRLAENSSYLNQPGLSAAEAQQANVARDMFAELFSNPIVQRDLPQIVGPWWNYHHRSSEGILLWGKVTRAADTAAGELVYVDVPDGEHTVEIPLLLGRDAPAVRQWAGFVGTILADPAGLLPGLESPLPQIVVVHYSFSLPPTP